MGMSFSARSLMKSDPRFTEGLALFDKKEYYECHEVIEALWLETSKDDRYRDLYQGVIQAAAAMYQLDRGILSGAQRLRASAVAYLKPYEPQALGADVSGILKTMEGRFQTWTSKNVGKKL